MISKWIAVNSLHILQWFSLNDVKHGRLHLVLEWLPTVTQPDMLQQACTNESLAKIIYMFIHLLLYENVLLNLF